MSSHQLPPFDFDFDYDESTSLRQQAFDLVVQRASIGYTYEELLQHAIVKRRWELPGETEWEFYDALVVVLEILPLLITTWKETDFPFKGYMGTPCPSPAPAWTKFAAFDES